MAAEEPRRRRLRRVQNDSPDRAISVSVLYLLTGHRVFDHSDNHGKNGASDAATDQLSNDRSDIETAASRCGNRGNDSLKKLSAAKTAYCSCDRIPGRSQIGALHPAACCVATDNPGDDLNDDVDDRC